MEAFKWYRKASKNGHDEATYNVGIRYLYVEGIPENSVKALKWFKLAQERGETFIIIS